MNMRFKIIQSRAIYTTLCKLFHLPVTLFPNTMSYFLMSSLLRLLNNFLEWPLLLTLSYSKIDLRQQYSYTWQKYFRCGLTRLL